MNDNIIQEPSSVSIAELTAVNLSIMQPGQRFQHVIPTGLSEFDRQFGGFPLGELVLIGGRPGMGKTQLLVNLALNMSKHVPVQIHSVDLNGMQLINRFFAAMSGISTDRLMTEQLTPDELAGMEELGKELSERPIYISDKLNGSVAQMIRSIEHHIRKKGVRLIFIDYLQLLAHRLFPHRDCDLDTITGELRRVAKLYQVCIVSTCQINRSVEYRGGLKRPVLSDIRGSGIIEQDADMVIMLYRPAYYGMEFDENNTPTGGLTELIVSKNRNGRLGTVLLSHDKSFTRFGKFVIQGKPPASNWKDPLSEFDDDGSNF